MKRVFAFTGFSFAITLIVLNLTGYRFSLMIAAASLVAFCAFMLIKSTRRGRVLPIVAGSAAFACIIFAVTFVNSVEPARQLDGKSVVTSFYVTDIPTYNISSDSYSYTVKTTKIEGGGVQEIKLKLKSSEKLDADYYDNITATLKYYTLYDNAFDSYSQYGDGIYINAKIGDYADYTVTECENKPLNYYLISLRLKIRDIITDNLKGNSAGISYALVTGDKSLLSADAQENIRYCGLSHYLAVSGFHVSLICMGLYTILRRLKVPRVVNAVVTLVVMTGYCAVADFSKSAVRACIMLGVTLLAGLVNTGADSLNSLGISVFVLCLNPFAVSDISAFLTVSAMLGILVIYRELKIAFKVKSKAAGALLLSISVLISIMPAMFIFFGNMSVGSVILNPVVEPLVIILIVSALLLCALFATPLCGVICAVINFTSKLLLKIIGFTADNLTVYGSIDDEIFGVALAAVFLFAGVCLLVKRKIPVRAAAAFTAAAIALGFCFSAYRQYTQTIIYVPESGMVTVYDADSAVIIGVDGEYEKSSAEEIAYSRNAVYIDCGVYGGDKDLGSGTFYCGEMQVETKGGITFISTRGRVLEIGGSYVIIDGYRIDRNGDGDGVTVCFSQNTLPEVRQNSG